MIDDTRKHVLHIIHPMELNVGSEMASDFSGTQLHTIAAQVSATADQPPPAKGPWGGGSVSARLK